jgi:hypothetical protein
MFLVMTAVAEQVVNEFRSLPLEERREVWKQLSQIVLETPAPCFNEAEFESALNEVVGCTALRNATGRLLEERQRERQREQTQLQARHSSRSHG